MARSTIRSLIAFFVLSSITVLAGPGRVQAQADAAGEKSSDKKEKTVADVVGDAERLEGFLDVYWDEKEGKVYLRIDRFDQELLYIESLAAGIGSNDIGLDRGQLGSTRVVEFRRVGPKVLMVQENTRYRAVTDNAAEARAVREAFAESVIWGFTVAAEDDDGVIVDATSFVLSDGHDVALRLQQSNQGSYKLDASRSAVYAPRTKAFPKNTELEATLTFTGEPKGGWIRSVAPSADAITVRQHHSFVELPDDGYELRAFDPRSGYIQTAYYDYATPIDRPLVKRVINRHRLEKKDPAAEISEAVEPIVYYLDPGAPEPIRSALLEGARWWNQAFEAAGYRDAFRVELLPEDADPLDVRYNLIQWVHRSTRGWSYGSSVTDPRTGEIIKGHVTLGSLRVRQDFLIAEGLLSPYADASSTPDAMTEMALARLRQLSAHEVGHTIGLVHNYASSVNDRASVMDYPHPWVRLADDGTIDLSAAYDTGIGEWDKRAILFGYQDFPEGVDEQEALDEILREARADGLLFIADQDARPLGGAHPLAHLWDNGESASAELQRIGRVRRVALERMGERTVPVGAPLALIEEALVPIYLLHRYQIEAAAKVVGGVDYTYAVRGDGQPAFEPVSADQQRAALDALLETLSPEFLALPETLIEKIPPRPLGYSRGRENFPSWTGVTFDPLAAAQVSVDMTLGALLHPERASRLVALEALDAELPGLDEVIDALRERVADHGDTSRMATELSRVVDHAVVRHLIALAGSDESLPQARGIALAALNEMREELDGAASGNTEERGHRLVLARAIELFLDHPGLDREDAALVRAPDGSPIGSGEVWMLPGLQEIGCSQSSGD